MEYIGSTKIGNSKDWKNGVDNGNCDFYKIDVNDISDILSLGSTVARFDQEFGNRKKNMFKESTVFLLDKEDERLINDGCIY